MDKAQGMYMGMNTLITHTIFGNNAHRALTDAKRETKRLERILSRFEQKSDISRLNRAAGRKRTHLLRETFEILSIGQEVAINTNGCFDMTVGPMVDLWRQTNGKPQTDVVGEARSAAGYQTLRLFSHRRCASLQSLGQSLDLGGIGKGYAADRINAILQRNGIRSACSDFGGNVAVLGLKPDGRFWEIGIRHPDPSHSLIGSVSVKNCSVVTTGDDQRAVVADDGTKHSHIINPKTGWPVQNNLYSVTVVSSSSAVADALATALYTAGIKQGLLYLTHYPGTEAIFLDQNLTAYITSGLVGRFRAAEGIKTKIL